MPKGKKQIRTRQRAKQTFLSSIRKIYSWCDGRSANNDLITAIVRLLYARALNALPIRIFQHSTQIYADAHWQIYRSFVGGVS